MTHQDADWFRLPGHDWTTIRVDPDRAEEWRQQIVAYWLDPNPPMPLPALFVEVITTADAHLRQKLADVDWAALSDAEVFDWWAEGEQVLQAVLRFLPPAFADLHPSWRLFYFLNLLLVHGWVAKEDGATDNAMLLTVDALGGLRALPYTEAELLRRSEAVAPSILTLCVAVLVERARTAGPAEGEDLRQALDEVLRPFGAMVEGATYRKGGERMRFPPLTEDEREELPGRILQKVAAAFRKRPASFRDAALAALEGRWNIQPRAVRDQITKERRRHDSQLRSGSADSLDAPLSEATESTMHDVIASDAAERDRARTEARLMVESIRREAERIRPTRRTRADQFDQLADQLDRHADEIESLQDLATRLGMQERNFRYLLELLRDRLDK